jgi:seryl-tRNA synthetase
MFPQEITMSSLENVFKTAFDMFQEMGAIEADTNRVNAEIAALKVSVKQNAMADVEGIAKKMAALRKEMNAIADRTEALLSKWGPTLEPVAEGNEDEIPEDVLTANATRGRTHWR